MVLVSLFFFFLEIRLYSAVVQSVNSEMNLSFLPNEQEITKSIIFYFSLFWHQADRNV